MKRSEENFKAATRQYKEPDYCTALSLGVQAGWRLPTIDELEALYDSTVSKPYTVRGPIEASAPGSFSGTLNNSGEVWSF